MASRYLTILIEWGKILYFSDLIKVPVLKQIKNNNNNKTCALSS